MAIKRTNRPIAQREGGDAIFGEGTDGPVTIASGTISLTKDMYYTDLTVNSGATLFTNGFRVFVNGTFTNNGTVGMSAGTAHSVADGDGTIAGRQTALNPPKAWGTSTDPISVTDLYDLDDAVSGFFITGAGVVTKITGGSLGVVGSAGSITSAATGPFAGSAGDYPGASTGQAGGAGNAGTAGTAATAGTGGAGGLGGGLVIIFAKTIAGSGTLVSYGFAGSAGNPATQGAAGPAGNPAPNITGYHTSGTFHHPAGSTGPNPGAGNPHAAGHNSGTHPTTHHHPAGSTGPNPGAGNPHAAGHNSGTHPTSHHHPAGSTGPNPGAGTPVPASHNAGTHPTTHHHPAGSTGPNPGAGTPHPSGHHSGTHPHTAATVNTSTGAVTSNRGAAPSHTATNADYTGGAGGAAGVGGTANPGETGVTGSTGGIIVVTRNAGNAAGQLGHSNYSKIIDI